MPNPSLSLGSTRASAREQKERIRAVEIEPLGETRARGREAERGRDVHAVRNDVDLVTRETRDRRELVGALVGDSDVADARVGARDEVPRIARMTFGGVLRVAPSEVVGPR